MVKIQGNYCTYRNLTILETLEVWCLSSLGTNENLFSEGLLPGFGSYCTYTRNKILAKKKKNADLLASCYKKCFNPSP